MKIMRDTSKLRRPSLNKKVIYCLGLLGVVNRVTVACHNEIRRYRGLHPSCPTVDIC
jgi:hypothetical protein